MNRVRRAAIAVAALLAVAVLPSEGAASGHSVYRAPYPFTFGEQRCDWYTGYHARCSVQPIGDRDTGLLRLSTHAASLGESLPSVMEASGGTWIEVRYTMARAARSVTISAVVAIGPASARHTGRVFSQRSGLPPREAGTNPPQHVRVEPVGNATGALALNARMELFERITSSRVVALVDAAAGRRTRGASTQTLRVTLRNVPRSFITIRVSLSSVASLGGRVLGDPDFLPGAVPPEVPHDRLPLADTGEASAEMAATVRSITVVPRF